MSYQYLKDHTYYSELYDRMTIDDCECWDSEVYDAYKKSGKKFDPEKPKRVLHGGLVADLALYFKKGEHYANKEETIRKWMSEAQLKDEKVASAIEPKGVRCLGCSRLLTNCISRDLMTNSNNKDEVLFMFECDICHKRRAYWENGNEWKSRLDLCEKCKSETHSESIRKDNTVETTYSCSHCHHQRIDNFDLSVKEESIDHDFEVKRKKYCLSEKEGREYITGRTQRESISRLDDEIKEREKNSDLYEAVSKIKKLTIVELQTLLNPLIEKAGYAKLDFGKPDLRKDVVVEFSLQDAKSGRVEYDSVHNLQKLLKGALSPTNWRLMSDGVSYRLGFLQGRLRGIEGEESLRKLVELEQKKIDTKLSHKVT